MRKVILALAALVTVSVAASCEVYTIRDQVAGQVLWNAGEAYFFIKITHFGYRSSYLLYPWEFAKAYLAGVTTPDQVHSSFTVIRVTPAGVERHALELEDGPGSGGPDFITPLEDGIYANYPTRGGLCRWSGDHFEPATQEENRRLDGIKHLTTPNFENGPNGWSRRAFWTAETDSTATIDVGDRFRLSVNTFAANKTRYGAVLIDCLRPGKAAERIGDLQERWGRVSKTEYQHAFQNRQ